MEDDEIVEDELWENQRREGSSGLWLPATDRGRYSDRFGRFQYSSLAQVPIPNNSRVIEEFHVASPWTYGKNFATLESDLAKGMTRSEKWNYSCRWQRWIRKRCSSREASVEIMSSWLGSKERRGTWKSRYFILMGSSSVSGLAAPSSSGIAVEEINSEDESSSDEGDADDVVEGQEEKITNKPLEESESISASTQLSPPIQSVKDDTHQPPVLFYLRRGFEDPRAAFPLTFDLNELRRLPKKQIRAIKITNRTKVDDTLCTAEYPGRFALKFPSGRKRVLNAATAELRERWVEVFRALLDENANLSSPKMQGRFISAFRAAKRGDFRRGFSLRRSSQGDRQIISTVPPLPLSPYKETCVEILRSQPEGLLNIRLAEQNAGRGLVIEQIFENCRDGNGNFPTNLSVGDVVVAVQGETLLGFDKGRTLQEFRRIVAEKVKLNEKVLLTVVSSCVTPPPQNKKRGLSPDKKSPVSFDVDDSEKEDEVFESFKIAPLSSVPSLQQNDERNFSSSSINSQDLHPKPTIPIVSSIVLPQSTITRKTEVPTNSYGIVSSHARAVTLRCLETMVSNGNSVTYAQLRTEVAKVLQVPDNGFETDEWRLWFRSFLDFWVCDGIKYSVGGLDMTDFTPVIQKIE